MKKVIVITTVGLILVFLVLFFPKSEKSLSPLNIAVLRGEYSALIYLADTWDFFTQHGLQVNLIEVETGLEALTLLKNGKADLSTASEFVGVSVFNTDEDLRVLASIASSDAFVDIICREAAEEPIRMGLKRKSLAEYYFHLYLTYNQLNADNYAIIDTEPGNMKAALGRQDLDGVVIWQPHAFEIVNELDDVAVRNLPIDYNFFFLIYSDTSIIESKHTLIHSFFQALLDCEAYCKKDEKKTFEAINRTFNNDTVYAGFIKNNINLNVELSQSLVLALENEMIWAWNNGLILNNVNPLEFIDSQFIDDLKPAKNTIF